MPYRCDGPLRLVLYLLAKAKLRYVQEQNEALQGELRVTRAEMRREREGKERAVNHVLGGLFGAKAEGFLVATYRLRS